MTQILLFKPSSRKGIANKNTSPVFPDGDLGFLQAISPIEANFNPTEFLQPSGVEEYFKRN
ncbi:hypothetical protein QNI16_11320 [Cytophagaceae bacterium YF14B1]|uniref:Uncharacterized protein n=1 Tax=Xanthocytophaga flava TaxID=3048013 RepID=A0AAE3QPY6_9BACT|nr:hypothetical protein [Xanthocytophaga flavus]MDJ1481075.1 hypothetical protein [Xanthocytophaga flavus]